MYIYLGRLSFRKSFLLINPYIVNKIFGREEGVVDCATVIASYCKVEPQIVSESVTMVSVRVFVIAAHAFVEGLVYGNLIQKLAIQVYADPVIIPFQEPDMELIPPVRILRLESGHRMT